jgi:outer membrane protein assembly factor BamB
MKPLYLFLALILMTGIFIPSCKKDASKPKSPTKIIDSLNLFKGDSTAFTPGEIVVKTTGDTIVVSVPAFTDITALRPVIVITGKTISPASGVKENFSDPVVYTVTAEDGSQQKYTVIVSVRGVVYFGSSDNNFYAVDAVLGTDLWKTTGGDFSYSNPTLVNGVIYAGNIDNNMYAMDATTGVVKWKFLTSLTIESAPTVVNGLVYFGNDGGNFYALDANTGQLKWEYYAGGNISTRPFVTNGIVYFGSDNSYVNALDATSGAVIWRYQAGALFNASSPTIVNGILYIGCRDSYLYALDAAAGTLKWKYFANNISLEMSNATVANGVVYIGGWYNISDFTKAGSLYAVDAVTGLQKWTALNALGIGSDPAVADDMLYITCDDNNIYAINVNTQNIIWHSQILANGASPAVSGGVVYCGDGGNHNFDALDTRNGTVVWRFSVGANALRTSTPIVVGSTTF